MFEFKKNNKFLTFPKGLLVLSFLFVLAQSAYPCKCIKSTLKNNYSKANAIAIVEVISSVEKSNNTRDVTLKISRTWKSDLPETLTIMIEKDSCEYELIQGKKHLLYLELLDSGIYTTSQCSGNLAENKSASAVKWLKSKGKKAKVT